MWINNHRQHILTFARECRANIEHSSDEWTNVLNVAEEYEKYVEDFNAEAASTEEEILIAPDEIDMGDTEKQDYGLDSLPEFGKDDIAALEKILEGLSFSVNSESEVLNIIMEEAGAYFAGQKSTDEVSDIIQSRIQVYLKENE